MTYLVVYLDLGEEEYELIFKDFLEKHFVNV